MNAENVTKLGSKRKFSLSTATPHRTELLCRQVRNAHRRVCPKGKQEGRANDDKRVWVEERMELSVRPISHTIHFSETPLIIHPLIASRWSLGLDGNEGIHI